MWYNLIYIIKKRLNADELVLTTPVEKSLFFIQFPDLSLIEKDAGAFEEETCNASAIHPILPQRDL